MLFVFIQIQQRVQALHCESQVEAQQKLAKRREEEAITQAEVYLHEAFEKVNTLFIFEHDVLRSPRQRNKKRSNKSWTRIENGWSRYKRSLGKILHSRNQRDSRSCR